MAVKKKGLGRGLEALMGAAGVTKDAGHEAQSSNPQSELRELPVEWVRRGRYQPRRDFDQSALEELAASIRAQGLMQPIVVRSIADQQYEIVAGERRWRACQLAGLEKIPALVREIPDEAAIAMALIENIQRENLNAMEEAQALHRLQHEFELTQQEVADAVGKSRATVANLLRLMQLNDDVKILLERGDIETGHAKALLGLHDQQQSEAARHVVAKAMTVRQTEAYVRSLQDESKPKEKARPNPDIQRLERTLGDRLGAKVAIQHSAKGKGKLVINYTNLEELDGILAHIH